MQVLRFVLLGALLSSSVAETPENLEKSSKMLRAKKIDLSRSAPRLEVGPREAIPEEKDSKREAASQTVIGKADSADKTALDSDISTESATKKAESNKKAESYEKAKSKSETESKDRSRRLLRSEPRLEVGSKDVFPDEVSPDCTAPTSAKTKEAESEALNDAETKKVEKSKKASVGSDILKVGPGTNPGSEADPDAKAEPKQKLAESSLGSPVPAKRSLMTSTTTELRKEGVHLRTAA